MKFLKFTILLLSVLVFGQKIKSVQLFNPQTNDETPVIKFGEQLVLNFDDLEIMADEIDKKMGIKNR